jgi:hypothetical protein
VPTLTGPSRRLPCRFTVVGTKRSGIDLRGNSWTDVSGLRGTASRVPSLARKVWRRWSVSLGGVGASQGYARELVPAPARGICWRKSSKVSKRLPG